MLLLREEICYGPQNQKLGLYRQELDQVEPMHERIIEKFLSRLKPQATGEVLTGMYQNQDSRKDEHQWRIIEQCKSIQDELKQKREATKTEQKRVARAKVIAESAFDSGMNPFDGSVDRCTICLDAFGAGDHVCRLICRHVFHEKCLQAFILSCTVKDPACPECRGSTKDPKPYVYIAESQFVISDSSGDPRTRR